MRLADRLGGHLVTGHVDGVGAVAAIEKQGEFTIVTFDVPAPLGALLVPKGSVAVDGISLTVNDLPQTAIFRGDHSVYLAAH